MNEAKNTLRKTMRGLASKLSPEDERLLSGRIWKKLETLSEFESASTVLIYMSIRGEVQTGEFLEKWDGKKNFVIPKVCGKKLELKKYDKKLLEKGYLGIAEPSAEAISVKEEDIDFAIIPGVAFARSDDGKVSRLGHGGGFYDRLLPLLHCPKAAVAYSFRIVRDLPLEACDAPLDLLVTE